MDGGNLKFTKKDRLFANLYRAAPEVRKELTQAVAKGAVEMQTLSKQLAPVRSGQLRDSITVSVPEGGVNPSITVEAGGELALHARDVEFGTPPRKNAGIFAGTDHPGTRPQPFFFPAYRLTIKRNLNRIARSIRKGLKKHRVR